VARKTKAQAAIHELTKSVLGKELQGLLDEEEWRPIDRAKDIIPTGRFEFDEILFRGLGGLVRGARYELYGLKGAHKSTTGYEWLGAIQKHDDRPVFLVNTERVLKKTIYSWARMHGCDTDRIEIIKPANLDQTYKVLVALGGSGYYSAGLWDSYGATAHMPTDPKAMTKYDKKEYGSKLAIAEGARTNTQGIPDVRDAFDDTGTTLIVVNQGRLKLGTMGSYVIPVISPGGNAFHHMFDCRMMFARRAPILEDNRVVGVEVRVEVQDSRLFVHGAKTGPKDGDCPDIQFYFDGRKPDPTETIAKMAQEVGIITQSGAHYTWGETKYHGKDKLHEAITPVRSELWEQVKLVRDRMGIEPEIDEFAAFLDAEDV